MNARYPVRHSGPWAQVKHHQVMAALGAAVMVTAVVGAAVAWNARDTSGSSTSAASVDLNTGAAEIRGLKDAVIVSPGGDGVFDIFAGLAPDLNTGAAEIRGLKDAVIVSPGGDGLFDLYAGLTPDLNTGAAEIRGLKDAVIVSPGGDGVFDLFAGLTEAEAIAGALAEHDAAFPAIDPASTRPGSANFDILAEAADITRALAQHDAAFPASDDGGSGATYPASREGTRGHVSVE